MAKKTNPKIREQLLAHVAKLFDKHGPKFFVGVEEADSKKGTINFDCTIDLSETAPIVTTGVSFKDKTTELGMDVTKSFSASVTDELEDEAQPGLGKIRDEAKAGTKKGEDAEKN